jgi:N-acetyl sugar amidotransferase
MIRYCSNCLYPHTKPDLTIHENGLCDACNHVEKLNKINWENRREELGKILEKYKSKDGSKYDCIIPVSGGKDSHYQTHVIKNEFGLNPLCVSYHLPEFTDLGRQNIENLKKLNVDVIEFTPNPEICLKMQKIGFTEFGDAQWPEHFGIFTFPVQVAVKYKIPLIIWGENSQAEYGGPAKDAQSNQLDEEWTKNYGTRVGGKTNEHQSIEDLKSYGIDKKYLQVYRYPTKEEINNVGIMGIFLGHYLRWNVKKQLDIVKKQGFVVHEGPTEGTFTNYENLDNKVQGIHDYIKWLKFGYGRATDNASVLIRLGELSRKDGLKLVKQYEGKIPKKYLNEFLDKWNMNFDEFLDICDKFTNKELFKKDSDGNLIREIDLNLTKINYDNI